MSCAIMVHGGLKTLSREEEEPMRAGCLSALAVGWQILRSQGSALEAVEQAVRALEDNPLFNAGFGSALNADGEVEMDAAIMDGSTLRAGGVAVLRQVSNPISVARRVMESSAVLLAGEGARRFAEEHCPELCTSDSMITWEAQEEWRAHGETAQPASKDTVGAVALDSEGNLAAATSTGGLCGKLPGRIGVSPLVGCGLYADLLGAVSLTGDGESIIRTALASRLLGLLHTGVEPQAAAEAGIAFFREHVPGEAGCILLDRQGRIGWTHHSPNMSGAYMNTSLSEPVAFTGKERARG
jgi:beta-aspartyl-peptidase (threonine type)